MSEKKQEDQESQENQPRGLSGLPLMLLRLEKDGLVVYPRMKQLEYGSWTISDPELLKFFQTKQPSSEK